MARAKLPITDYFSLESPVATEFRRLFTHVSRQQEKSDLKSLLVTSAVTAEGNPIARKLLEEIFEPADVAWRGIGVIAQSGLKIRPAYADLDAEKRFVIELPESSEPKGCACGEILTGTKTPP